MYIMFDFDGVIYDTDRNIFNFYRKELAKKDIDLPESAFHLKPGNNSEKFLTLATKLSKDEIIGLVKKRREQYFNNIENEVLIDGVADEIKRLSENHKLAICSTSPRELIISLIRSKRIEKFFSFILSADDVKMQKPDPEVYNLARSRFELIFGETVNRKNGFIIEDSPVGIAAAKASGLNVIGITTSFPKEQLRKIGADFTINSYNELKDIIV
jgi:beta-phosphoglucomutase